MIELAMWASGRKRSDYEAQRMFEELGLDIDAAMRARQVTIMALSRATKLSPHYILAILRGTAADIELRHLTDIGLALGCRWDPVILLAQPPITAP